MNEKAKTEIAVVMVGEHGDHIVFGRGVGIESDKEAGLDATECGPTPDAPEEKGLWIWEGTVSWSDGRNYEGVDEGAEPTYHGSWRRPTPDETHQICAGDFDCFGPLELSR